MELLTPTLGQMVILFIFILIGYVLAKSKFLPKESAGVLSKLENMVFMPALILDTMSTRFTVEMFSSSWKIFLAGLLFTGITVPFGLLVSGLCTRDIYTRKLFAYGLCFPNTGFVGNAIFKALFPDQFILYIIFTLPQLIMVYLWGVPFLLAPSDMQGAKKGSALLSALKNPTFISIFIGGAIGLSGLKLPSVVATAIVSASNCMSPVAMILTGLTVAYYSLGQILKDKEVYFVVLLRLIIIPLIVGLPLKLIGLQDPYMICTICTVTLPLGLNTVIIPAVYGKDLPTGTSMALISHTLSVITIPLLFAILL